MDLETSFFSYWTWVEVIVVTKWNYITEIFFIHYHSFMAIFLQLHFFISHRVKSFQGIYALLLFLLLLLRLASLSLHREKGCGMVEGICFNPWEIPANCAQVDIVRLFGKSWFVLYCSISVERDLFKGNEKESGNQTFQWKNIWTVCVTRCVWIGRCSKRPGYLRLQIYIWTAL